MLRSMKSLQSLKSKLIILLIGVVLLTTILLGAFQYFFVMKNYETLDLQRRALLEDNILKLMKATDSVYQMVEAPIEKESQVILARMVADYNQKGLSGIDLHDYYDEESGLELYIIDQSDTVIAATYKPDIGLNFSKFAGVDEFLDGIRDEGKFFSDRLSLSSLENIVMKYSYLPTPDGMYIFETGSPIDKDKAIPDVLSFGDFGDSISKNQGFVVSALLFSKYGVTFNEDVSEVKQINPSFKHYYNKALDTLQPVTFEGTYDGQAVTIKYLPFSFAGAGDLHEHTVIELIYSNADLQKSKNQVILLMLLTILLGSGLIAALAVRMSNTLVSPLDILHDGMERVSRGDYDSRILLETDDEFSNIARHFNEMTERIKASMADQQAKEEEIKTLYKNEASMNETLLQMMASNKQGYFETIKALVNAEDEKDAYTKGHCERVMNYSLNIGKSINLTEKDMDILRFGAILHDLGKIGIPEQILNKGTALTNEELALIRQHPSIGARILNDLTFMQDSIRIVHEHHEWHDGHGYPRKLKGEEIDLLARIVCVADAFDAMTTQRPYRKKAMTIVEAIQELRDKSGTQFDPGLVKVFVSLLEQDLIENMA